MRKFIIISLILIGVALIATVVVWYLLQGLLEEKDAIRNESAVTNSLNDTNASTEAEDTADESSDIAPLLDLTPEQRAAAKSIGIDPDAFAITDAMLNCASDKLSSERIEEILAGSAPTVLEALSLIPCLKN